MNIEDLQFNPELGTDAEDMDFTWTSLFTISQVENSSHPRKMDDYISEADIIQPSSTQSRPDCTYPSLNGAPYCMPSSIARVLRYYRHSRQEANYVKSARNRSTFSPPLLAG